jgi:hypothetical protein
VTAPNSVSTDEDAIRALELQYPASAYDQAKQDEINAQMIANWNAATEEVLPYWHCPDCDALIPRTYEYCGEHPKRRRPHLDDNVLEETP